MVSEEHNDTIGVIGLGHVGLTTALGLAEMGWSVVGTDSDAEKVALVQKGSPPFYEPDLEQLLRKHLGNGRFKPIPDVEQALEQASTLFVCVGTPQKSNGDADVTAIEGVAQAIARHLNGYKLVVEKSTGPVMTAHWIRRTIERYRNGDGELDVACNPEFLRQGTAVHDVLYPERVVFGLETERARDILTRLYAPLNCPIMLTDLNTAEIIKHAANAFLSTKISFINMVADLCEATNADVTQVAQALGLDQRIGPGFLNAGIGFGGYCLPKDLRAFMRIGEVSGVDFSLLREVERINLSRVEHFLGKLLENLWVLQKKTLGILGLSFKPGTDDIREAPSLEIIGRLLQEGAVLQIYDPQAMSEVQRIYPSEAGRISYVSSAYEAARGADALLLLTEWPEFKDLDMAEIRRTMRLPMLLDGRNLFDPSELRRLGFTYYGMGRP